MKYITCLLILLLCSKCVPVSTVSTGSSSKQLIFNNIDYEPVVGAVKLYPARQRSEASLEYPVIPLGNNSFRLEFDLLEENYRPIYARYIHCNANWKKSDLSDLQFLSSYNEFPINEFKYSENTRIPYVNYTTELPSPEKSGNYLLVIYDQNTSDILLSRRVLVYDQKTNIDARIMQSSIVSKRDENHQIEFSLTYDGINNANPLQDFRVVLLQNHNWNSAIDNLEPTLMRTDQKYLEYRHFNGENNFPGLNEFRFIDLRSIDYRGMNISEILKNTENVEAFVTLDKPRKNLAYTQLNNDLNGNFVLENRDPTDTELQSEYVDVHFQLKSRSINGDIYIVGSATNWQLDTTTLMQYNPETETYNGTLQLRQGYYDYAYWVQSNELPPYEIEGSFWQTANNYEILFYYRNPANNYDELIGYKQLLSGN